MKRIHLFEFEDQAWFPGWLRTCMTRLIMIMHKFLKTGDDLQDLLRPMLKEQNQVVDLCSGSGGPILMAFPELKKDHSDLELVLTDLYPDTATAEKVNNKIDDIRYLTQPVDASNPPENLYGIRTLVGSFHHMRPEVAEAILKDAVEKKQSICILEISDNSIPKFLWWIAIPVNIITCLLVTPLVRPLTWYQLVFTYLIPILPILFAWDGAVSNIRTYTLNDLNILLEGLKRDDYVWESGIIKGKSKKIYLTGTSTKP